MIQWYPGHMAKAIREVSEKVKIVDLVIILLDARIPKSSFNPLIKDTIKQKPTLYLLTKKDKADLEQTSKWLNSYEHSLAIDTRSNKDIKKVLKMCEDMMKEKRAKDALKGLKPRPIKTMIVGIPNVGKSTLINSLVGKKVAVTGDKPGVTKVQQWIKINQNLELLDTPGILWPKFEDQVVGMHLAITGAIKDNILPIHDVALYLISFLKSHYPNVLTNRYQIDESVDENKILTEIGKKQNYYLSNHEVDLDRTSLLLLQEFRNNSLGYITLDQVDELLK